MQGEPEDPHPLHILHGLASSLSEAHAKGVTHRDIKPGNIFISVVDDREYVKLLDFGIAKAQRSEGPSPVTRTGMMVGTPAYVAPEQALDRQADARSDIYALGVVAYECLCGERPFLATDFVPLLRQHAEELPLPLSAREPPVHVSPDLEALVLQMLAKRPEDRPADGRALRARVEELLRRAGASPEDQTRTVAEEKLAAWATQADVTLPSPDLALTQLADTYVRPRAGAQPGTPSVLSPPPLEPPSHAVQLDLTGPMPPLPPSPAAPRSTSPVLVGAGVLLAAAALVVVWLANQAQAPQAAPIAQPAPPENAVPAIPQAPPADTPSPPAKAAAAGAGTTPVAEPKPPRRPPQVRPAKRPSGLDDDFDTGE